MGSPRNFGLCLLLSCLLPDVGLAAEPATPTQLSLGRPARVRTVQVSVGPERTVLRVGTRRVPLPWAGIEDVQLDRIEVGPKAAVLRVRASADGARYTALIGGPGGSRLLWQQRTDPRGDPGERRARALRVVADDAGAGVWVGQTREQLKGCGDEALPLLAAQRVDPATLQLRADPGPQVSRARVLEARPLTDGAQGPPQQLALWRPDAAWDGEQLRVAGEVGATPLSGTKGTALLFGSWRSREIPPTTVALRPPEGGRLPTHLWLLGLGDRPVRLNVADAARASGVLANVPASRAPRCLAIALPAQPGTGLGPVTVRSELDEGDTRGVARLVQMLARQDARASSAAQLLRELGASAAPGVVEAWAQLPRRSRSRVLPVLLAAADRPEARQLLKTAAVEGDRDTRARVLSGLAERRVGKPLLGELAQRPDALGDEAATLLGREPSMVEALLRALDAPAGAGRPAVREALARAARRDAATVERALTAFMARGPSEASWTAAVLALAPVEAMRPALLQALSARAEPQSFEARWRFVGATEHLGPSERIDDWLRGYTQSQAWMLRVAALRALCRRAPAERSGLSARAREDDYPRVRVTGLTLTPDREARRHATPLLTGDPWPQVRSEAARALGRDPETRAADLRAALGDRHRLVRAAAVDVARVRRFESLWPEVRARLENPREYAQVKTSAARFAAATCQQDAAETLAEIARSGVSQGADLVARELSREALIAMLRLGGEAAAEARGLIRADAALGGPESGLLQTPASCPGSQDSSSANRR